MKTERVLIREQSEREPLCLPFDVKVMQSTKVLGNFSGIFSLNFENSGSFTSQSKDEAYDTSYFVFVASKVLI